MTRNETWGNTKTPEQYDIERQFAKRPGSMFDQPEYEELEQLWKEITALGNPIEYATISRSVDEELGRATTIDIKYPGGRYEVYEIDGQKVNVGLMDEENNQHGFTSFYKPLEEMGEWFEEIVELEDDYTWHQNLDDTEPDVR